MGNLCTIFGAAFSRPGHWRTGTWVTEGLLMEEPFMGNQSTNVADHLQCAMEHALWKEASWQVGEFRTKADNEQ